VRRFPTTSLDSLVAIVFTSGPSGIIVIGVLETEKDLTGNELTTDDKEADDKEDIRLMLIKIIMSASQFIKRGPVIKILTKNEHVG